MAIYKWATLHMMWTMLRLKSINFLDLENVFSQKMIKLGLFNIWNKNSPIETKNALLSFFQDHSWTCMKKLYGASMQTFQIFQKSHFRRLAHMYSVFFCLQQCKFVQVSTLRTENSKHLVRRLVLQLLLQSCWSLLFPWLIDLWVNTGSPVFLRRKL